MRIRRTLTTAGLGLALVLSGTGVAQAADYPATPKPVSCKVSTPAGNTELKVNMGPNLTGSRYYTFRIEKKVSGVWGPYRGTFRTKGKTEVRTVDVPKGTYRVQCDGKYGRVAATSRTAKVKR